MSSRYIEKILTESVSFLVFCDICVLEIPDNNVSIELIADGNKGEEERGEKGREGKGEGGWHS